jgi:tRNA(Arg) A34 adenosine deaminase TadA
MTNQVEHERYMRRCIELARQAILTKDAPVGSLIVRGDQVIAEGIEAVRGICDVTARTRNFRRFARPSFNCSHMI